jgi:DNA polymerase-4
MEKRFFEWGIRSAERMYDLTEREMREIWGGIVGERFYKAIRGEQTEERESERGSVSHSKVLAPESRSFESAWPVILNLLMKACMRLRSEGFYAKEMWVSLKYVERDRERRRWQQRARFAETCDSLLLVKELERLWESAPRRTLLRVGVALSQLIPARNHQIGIFEDPKRESLMQALDSINHRYQGNVVYPAGAHASRAIRTNAIAFQRIPDESE